ncbi:MAG: YceI family protein [Solirubrobacterales bacterium]|nr:YceI family protein [Solirubrobacterales bacterium]
MSQAVDPSNASVGFDIKHMGIATVHGEFKRFAGTYAEGKLSGSVEVASVDTGDAERDGHLQKPEFFDAGQHPQIGFSSAPARVADGTLTLDGEITIKGVTKAITLTGTVTDTGFTLATTIDRRDFGLNFNQTMPGGDLLIANEVKLLVSVKES